MTKKPKQSKVAFSASRRAIRDKAIREAKSVFRSECASARDKRDVAIARAKAVCAVEIKRGPTVHPVDPRQPAPPHTNSVFSMPPSEAAAAIVACGRALPASERFHDRAFIATTYSALSRASATDGRSLDDFKALLWSLHRLRLIRLSRAELVGVMNPQHVRESALFVHGAEFNFIALD